MTNSDMKKHLPGRKLFAVWIIAFLLVGLVCFLMVDNYRNRVKLQQEAQLEFLRSARSTASGLACFFEERKYDLNTLAESRAIQSCFAVHGSDTPEGRNASLQLARECLEHILSYKKIADHFLYQRFMLVGRDGNILLDCSHPGQTAEQAAGNLYSVFNGKSVQGVVSLRQIDHVYAVVSVPCYYDEEYVASLLAIINTDSISAQAGSSRSGDTRAMMMLDSDTLCLLNRTPHTKVCLSRLKRRHLNSQGLFTVETNNHIRYLFAGARIGNTPFMVLNSARGDSFYAGNAPEMLSAMAILTALLFGSGVYFYRSAARNMVLHVRLEEENSRQQALEQVNTRLKREVSHRRQKELMLVEKEAMLRATIESTNEGILVVDPDGRIADWNRSFRELFKFTDIRPLATLTEMKEYLLELTQNSESFVNEFCTLHDTAERFSGELTLKNGAVIEYSARSMKALESPRGRVWTFRDVSTYKIAEQSLEQAMKSAEKSNKAKTEFLANMSHELRTPLNSVIGFSEVLYDEPLDDSQKAYVDNIHRSAINLLEMLDMLLLYSDIEGGRINRETRECVIWDIINHAKKRIRANLLKNGTHLDVICEKDTPTAFYTDPYLLTRILTAILDNACKFTEQGQILATFSHQVLDYQSLIRFTVKDTGVGIPRDQLENIFDVFSQADGSMSRKFGGMGAGLAIVKKLVWLLGGKIDIQSECGVGTTVTVTLPIKDKDGNPLVSASSQTPEAVLAGRSSQD